MGTGSKPASGFDARMTPQKDPKDYTVSEKAAVAIGLDPFPLKTKTTDDFLKKGMSPDVTDQRLRDALAMKMRNQGIGRRATFLGGFAEQSALGRY